jgi:hypothetical protein
MARFSIVVPTYNRAALLQHALPTAFEHIFDYFEIVASDNDSTDATAEVLAGCADPRLRVVRPDRTLSMVDHWEFALGHARGDWVLFLCDDDALLPHCLARLDEAIREGGDHEIVQYDRFRYVHGDGIRPQGNYIEIGRHVGSGVRVVNSARRLFSIFGRLSIEMPKLLNSAVKASLLGRIRARQGRVFGLWAPDVRVGVQMLVATPRYLKTGPLMLWGETMASYGSGAARDPGRMLQFFRQFPEFEGTLPLSPYPHLLTVTNCIYDTLSRLKRDLGSDLAHLEVDPILFRARMLKDVEQYIEGGHSGYTADRDQIRADLKRLRRTVGLDPRRAWRKIAARAGALPEKVRKLAGERKTTLIKQRHTFANIHEAARFVGRLAAS